MRKIMKFIFLTCIDSFSKYPSAETFDNANASNVKIFLDN